MDRFRRIRECFVDDGQPSCRQVQVGEHALSVLESGEGPPLLLLPAAPAWSFIYREFLHLLAPHFRCLAVDFPGTGLAPDFAGPELRLEELSRLVEELIVQLDLRDLTLLVHDSAGSIGVGAAARHAERVRGLILTDTFAWPLVPDFARVRRMLRIVTTPPVATLQTRFNLIPWAAITTAGGQRPTRAEKAAFLTGFDTAARRARVLSVLRGLIHETAFLQRVQSDLRQHLADTPALVLFGDKDPARDAGFEERWRQELTRATFHLIPGQMHFPHFGAAREMCDRITDWARSLPDGPTAMARLSAARAPRSASRPASAGAR